MTWARFDDDMLDHPKVIEAGGPGFALNAAAIIWCARNLTDGFIPAGQVARLIDLSEFKVALPKLLERLTKGTHGPLWEYDEARKGYVIHDYLDYNPSRADVEREREHARIRQGRRRVSRRDNAVTPPVTHGVIHAPVTGAPVPVPVTHTHTGAREGEPERIVPAELRGQSPIAQPIPQLVELVLLPRLVEHAKACGCSNPGKAWAHWHASRWAKRGDRKTWCTDWLADFEAWMLNHDRFGCPCLQSRPAGRTERPQPDGPKYRDLSHVGRGDA